MRKRTHLKYSFGLVPITALNREIRKDLLLVHKALEADQRWITPEAEKFAAVLTDKKSGAYLVSVPDENDLYWISNAYGSHRNMPSLSKALEKVAFDGKRFEFVYKPGVAYNKALKQGNCLPKALEAAHKAAKIAKKAARVAGRDLRTDNSVRPSLAMAY